MTQYVYGKNVVKQLLQEDKKIYEILMAEGMRDTALEKLIKEHKILSLIHISRIRYYLRKFKSLGQLRLKRFIRNGQV